MAKGSRNSGKEKQDQIYSQMQRDIRQDSRRNWLTITEQCIQDAKRLKPTSAQEVIRISHHNPNNPLNGSSSWSKQKWAEYNANLKATKATK